MYVAVSYVSIHDLKNLIKVDISMHFHHLLSLHISSNSIVTNVKRTKSILLSKEKLCPYTHESLERHGSPWKLTIANTSGGCK